MAERGRDRKAGRLALYRAFAGAAGRYWLLVYPRATAELRRHRRSAEGIEDPDAKANALAAFLKRENIEGAAAFAAFVPRAQRGAVIRALVAFQSIYNYTDQLAEQPSPDPELRARRLHGALVAALDPSPAGPEPVSAGDPFLAGIIRRCRGAVAELPSYSAVAPLAKLAAEGVVEFQSLSSGPEAGLRSWAVAKGGAGLRPGRERAIDFAWWELAAAAGSSLAVCALLAAAASPVLDEREAVRIHDAYAPGVCALHSLLDSLVDQAEDEDSGQLSLIRCYRSPEQAAERLCLLVSEAVSSVSELPRPGAHVLLVTAMVCSYLAASPGSVESQALIRRMHPALGPLARPAMLVFRLRRLARRVTLPGHGSSARRLLVDRPAPPASQPPDPVEARPDARAA